MIDRLFKEAKELNPFMLLLFALVIRSGMRAYKKRRDEKNHPLFI